MTCKLSCYLLISLLNNKQTLGNLMSTLQYVREIFKERIQQFQEYRKTPDVDEFQGLQKSVVLQQSRCFNDSQINDRKCRTILTQLIYLLNQGEKFNDTESQSLFFSITKLFQSNNYDLRRMIYLMIKEFRDENAMYIVISSLTKDITSKVDLFRMNALRTIPLVLEPSNLVQIERYMKSAIIDKNYAVSSAALLAGIQILRINPEIVRKWVNEVVDRLNSKYPQNNFHALILLHEIKKNDKVTFTKLIIGLTKENLVPIAVVQIIRFVKELVNSNELDQQHETLFLEYLLKQVHKSQEMIIFEACKALTEIKSLSNKDLQPLVSVLSVFLVSSNSINKFVSLKLINKLITNPIRRSLIQSTSEIEGLIHDHNKSLSSLAVSILLKICKEENIEKLLTQIYEYLSEMSDEFKIDVLRSVRALTRQNPKKWKAILSFLSQTLKCEASQDFKRYAVDIIEAVLNEIPEARDAGIIALADFIEDCQFAGLQLHILSILNREASKKSCSIKVIRIVNNRLHLEEAEIRAAAVGVLGKFMLNYPEVAEKVRPLIEETQFDPDDEVRNRGAFYTGVAASKQVKLFQDYAAPILPEELENLETYLQHNLTEIQSSTDADVLTLERARSFAESNKSKMKKTRQPVSNLEDEIQKQQFQQLPTKEDQSNDSENFEKYKRLFNENKAFNQYGTLRKISTQTELTDSKAEYLVTLTKFFFDEFIVCEFKVKNTLDNITLENVSCELTLKNPNAIVHSLVPASKINPESSSNVLVGLHVNPQVRLVAAAVHGVLTFTVKEINAATGKVQAEYTDDYPLEDFNISYSEYFVPIQWYKGQIVMNNPRQFKSAYETFKGSELQSTFQLDYKNTDIAVKELVKHFGLVVCENSDVIVPQNKYHTMYLAGKYLGVTQVSNQNQPKVLLVALIGFDQRLGCILKVTVKTEDETLTSNILETFG